MKVGNKGDEEDGKSNKSDKKQYLFDFNKFRAFHDDSLTNKLNVPGLVESTMETNLTDIDSNFYQPKNLCMENTLKVPNTPPIIYDENLSKFDEDALFFMFFIQQDYYALLAAKELKSRGWYYHKKYLTWFKLVGQPKMKADDRIEGKFKYFYFCDDDWKVMTRKDFKLEFKFVDLD